MATTAGNLMRLARAGIVLAQYGVRFVPKGIKAPLALHAARWVVTPLAFLAAPFGRGGKRETRVADALGSLGPSYIKLGQFLATRAHGAEWGGAPLVT